MQRYRAQPGVVGNEEDLFGEAVAALYRASERYELGPARFSSYATFHLRDAFRRHRRFVGFRSEHRAAERAKPSLLAWKWLERTGREPGDTEMARELGWSKQYLWGVLCRAKPVSLEAPADEFGVPLAEVMGDDTSVPNAVAERNDLRSVVRQAVDCLAPELRDVIERRFGLRLDGIGEDRSTPTARIMEKQALTHLRRMLGDEVAALRYGGSDGAEAEQAVA